MIHYQAFCILLLSILIAPYARVSGQNSDLAGDSRIIDFDREPVYFKVFVDSDNFGPSYLDSLEAAYPRVETDTIKFEILNDLAYYWHTRSLKRSLDLATDGLEMARAAGNKLWEGRFQITQGATLLRMEKLDSAQAVLQKARKKVIDEDLPLLLTQEGYIYERRGDLDMATEKAYEVLSLG